MADKVRYTIEASIPQLAYLERRGCFDQEEIQDIIRKRESYEYRLIKNKSKKVDFLEAIEYEMSLVI